MCVKDRHDMTLALIVALNPNTTNQAKKRPGHGLHSGTPCVAAVSTAIYTCKITFALNKYGKRERERERERAFSLFPVIFQEFLFVKLF